MYAPAGFISAHRHLRVMVTLKEITETLEMVNDDSHYFYDAETDKIEYYSDHDDLDEEDHERFENDRYIPLPNQFDLDGYEIMKDFCRSVDDQGKRDVLLTAIAGRGAFRAFRDFVRTFGMEEEWYAFRFAELRKVAKYWCDKHKIEYSDTK